MDFNAEDAESMERTEMTILQSLSMGVGDDLVASMVLASAGRQAEVCPTFVDTPTPCFLKRCENNGVSWLGSAKDVILKGLEAFTNLTGVVLADWLELGPTPGYA